MNIYFAASIRASREKVDDYAKVIRHLSSYEARSKIDKFFDNLK